MRLPTWRGLSSAVLIFNRARTARCGYFARELVRGIKAASSSRLVVPVFIIAR
jgi:hypothetical protein